MTALTLETFLEEARNRPVTDVRTPAEYEQGHIPGAVNIPLFNNQERAVIGTAYTREGREDAVMKGLEIVGPRMTSYVTRAREAAPERNVLVHCWRGGMRSGSFAWLLETSGFVVDTLDGGYKQFRRAALDFYDRPLPFLLVGGSTGSGKTDILHELAAKGEQVIDLEGLAHHKGSAFGGIGQQPQPTSEQFQNDLFLKIRDMDPERPIWLENESSYIGKVGLPDKLWKRMQQSPILEVCIEQSIRVERLVREYGSLDQDQLITAIEKISRKLGGQHMQQAITSLKEGNIHDTARILLTYYDKSYGYLLNRRSEHLAARVPMEKDDPKTAASKLIEKAKRINL